MLKKCSEEVVINRKRSCFVKLIFFVFILNTANNIFANPQLDKYIKSSFKKFPNSKFHNSKTFFSHKSIIIWGTNSDDEDEADINESMAENVVDFRIKKWLNQKDNVVKVIPDTDVTLSDLQNYNLILVGTPSSNIYLEKITKFLPIKINEEEIKALDKTFEGDEVGVNFRYINPYNTKTQIWVISAPSYEALRFIPKKEDYCIYQLTSYNPSADRFKELAIGDFSKNWELEKLVLVDNELIKTAENNPIELKELKNYEAPNWIKNGVMYEIFVRSFYDSDGDGIGDLNGITEKLDYLNDGNPKTNSDLGIKTIWLMPIFDSPSYHGYDVTNYFKINPDYGTNEDFRNLLKEAHKRGIKIITDIALNHCSSQHRFFKDAYGNLKSKYSNWFYFTNSSHTKADNWEFRTNKKDKDMLDPPMPAWNVNNPEVAQYLFRAAKYWLDPNNDGDFSDGIDGFRCDYVKGPPKEFWQNFRQEVKAINPNILLLAEDWEGLDSISKDFDNEFDMAFDFPFQGSLMEAVSEGNSRDFIHLISSEKDALPKNAVMNRFVNNHDMNRISSVLKPEQVKLAFVALLTFPDMPMLYYGDEIGMKGIKDPYDEGIRRPMEWTSLNSSKGTTKWYPAWSNKKDGISVEEESKNPESLFHFVKKLIALRNKHNVFETGKVEFNNVIINSGEDAEDYKRAISYTVSNKNENYVVIENLYKDKNLTIQLPKNQKINSKEILKQDGVKYKINGNKLSGFFPDRSFLIIKIK